MPETVSFNSIRDLLSDEEIQIIETADLVAQARHPTWYPLFYSKPRSVDYLSNAAVARISSEVGGKSWLQSLKPRLVDPADPEEAAAALAELRAYGALLEAGFNVQPIPTTSTPTADFTANAGDGDFVVEVFAKHQDDSQKSLLEDIESGNTPIGVHRSTSGQGNVSMEITVAELHPGGAPDPSKMHDSVQANLISRVCAAKGKETQFPTDMPSILWIDFTTFGLWPEALKLEQCCPVLSGHHGLTSGALWYAFYGWRGAPIFEEDFFPNDRVVPMGHDGRFRLNGAKKSKLSAAVINLHNECTILENPWATNRLPDHARRFIERLPWFDLTRAICDWEPMDADKQVSLGTNLINSMKAWRDRLSPP